MAEPAPSRHATAVPVLSRRIGIRLIAGVLTVHSFLVLLWVMPSNPVRDAIGDGRVSAYVNNDVLSFEQSWSIFAPVPRRVNDNVQVRATMGKGGGGRVTAWYDMTAEDDRRIRHVMNPSRIHSATRRLGSGVLETVAGLNEAQRDLIAQDLRSVSARSLERRLIAANPSGEVGARKVESYLDAERTLVRFSTLYAVARWGTEVTAVELRIGRRAVPRYAVREDDRFADAPITYTDLGWRTVAQVDSEAQEAFDAYVRRASSTKGSD